MLVVLEGLDGTGKSTLAKEINSQIRRLQLTKEPGSPWVDANKQIRELVLNNRTLTPLQRELLFYADAEGHRLMVESSGLSFLSDRGKWSHLAYLYGYLKTKQIDYEEYALCRQLINRVCIKPNAIVYLEGDIRLMKERLTGEKDAIESQSPEFFGYVLSQYEDLCLAAELEGIPLLKLNARDSLEINRNKSCDWLRALTS